MQFYPVPDTGDVTNANYYNILLDYTIQVQSLVNDADTPILPTEFQEAIAWYAIVLWSEVRQSQARYTLARSEFERAMNDMRHSQLPEQLPGLTEFFG